MGQSILGRLGAIGLDRPPADERHHQFRRMLALPAPDLWKERTAGATAGVGEEQHDRLAQSAQGLEPRRLSAEGRQDKAGSWAANG